MFGSDSYTEFVKDAFHRYLIDGDKGAINPKQRGTKVAGHYKLNLGGGESYVIKCRLTRNEDVTPGDNFSKAKFDDVFDLRKTEADHFYSCVLPGLQFQSFSLILQSKLGCSAT